VFPIVGVGASAGGLEAYKAFFSAVPAESGMAFVLIQHLDPTRESLTAELVGTYTRMSVVQAADGMQVEPNRVYVIPPNAYLSIRQRILRLSAPTAPRSLRMAVDFFLYSLAADQPEHAIGIILSGTGSDGTLGLKEIKAAGGMTMVQDPRSAQHDGMPRSAIASGSADYVLPAERMAAALLAYLRHAGRAPGGTAAPPPDAPQPLAAVVEVMRERAKFDFSGYKKGTLLRRIRRRMSLRHLGELSEYVKVLRGDPVEVSALFQDLLINVTSFFREPAAWQVLQEQVIRPLVAAKAPSALLRAWIPACASGEEAYSLAILLLEEIEAAGKACRLQVFASDVDVEGLATARAGIYPEGIAAHVSARRLSRFFVKGEHRYQVSKELRDAVVFAQQSLVSDPPFSRLDLISCRNLFIYLEPALQDRLLPLLHFALLQGGCLFLGRAEGIGPHEDLFEPISSKWRIYRRVGPTRPERLRFPLAAPAVSTVTRGRTATLPSPPRVAALAQQLLLQRYAPACVVIDRTGEILYFHGQTDDYLAQPSGLPTRDLIALARRGLRARLRGAIQDAVRDRRRIVVPGVLVRRGRTLRRVTTTVEPFDAAHAGGEGLWLVSFQDEPEAAASAVARPAAEGGAGDGALVQQLEEELTSTRDDLQHTIEDVRAANEELMSVNEEFQSSNEELETSKEELQSLNEELTTANAQLEGKIGELEAANNDLDNLLTSSNVATLFLDTHLSVRRFTPAATRLFDLSPSDIGRPLANVVRHFTDATLLSDAAAVLHRPITPQTEVQTRDGRWYVRQVLPYRTRDHRTEGVVITLSDVAAEALQHARLYAESIVDTVREPLLVLDEHLRVCSANRSFYATFRTTEADTVGRPLHELGSREWDIRALRRLLRDSLRKERPLTDFEVAATFATIGPRIMQLTARAIDRGAAGPQRILLAIDDVTERTQAQATLRENETRKHAEEQVRQRQAELAHALRISTVGELASGLAHELNQPLSAVANGVEACARYLRAGNANPEELLALLDEASGEALRAGSIVEHLRHFIEKGQPRFERTDLREIAQNVPRLLGRELQEGHIALRLDVPTTPLLIFADRIQIEQIMANLMLNAIDAIRDAPGERHEIELRVRAVKGMAEVEVCDTGSGISPRARERMFEPFFTTKAHGLGMGLAISRSILEAHRGRILVKPRADRARGTTVRFSLPLLRPPRAARRTPAR
jgi:chemotaxis methyl-accepting protein methylase/C4-dicarboxylate-specific signal transduction histidine kinase